MMFARGDYLSAADAKHTVQYRATYRRGDFHMLEVIDKNSGKMLGTYE